MSIGKVFGAVVGGLSDEVKGKVPGFGALSGTLERMKGQHHPVDDAILEPLAILEKKIDAGMEENQSQFAAIAKTLNALRNSLPTMSDAEKILSAIKSQPQPVFSTPEVQEMNTDPQKTVHLRRILHNEVSTIGLIEVPGMSQDALLTRAFTLEDPHQDQKIAGNTRIPAGVYPLALYNEGDMTVDYAKKYPHIHKGMIMVQNVPEFTGVLIHIGNEPAHTEGCVLVGDQFSFSNRNYIGASADAYQRIYTAILALIGANAPGEVVIDIRDDQIAGPPMGPTAVQPVAGMNEIADLQQRVGAIEARLGGRVPA